MIGGTRVFTSNDGKVTVQEISLDGVLCKMVLQNAPRGGTYLLGHVKSRDPNASESIRQLLEPIGYGTEWER